MRKNEQAKKTAKTATPTKSKAVESSKAFQIVQQAKTPSAIKGKSQKSNGRRAPPPPPPLDHDKLTTILVSQKPLGNYPLTVARLLELAALAWPGDAAFTDDAASKRFGTSAASTKRPALEAALVFLLEDADRLAAFPKTLQWLIERQVGEKPLTCPLKNLAKGCGAEFAEAVVRQTILRIEERRLPPGIGAILRKPDDLTSAELFVFERVIGEPAGAGSGSLVQASSPPTTSVLGSGDRSGHPVSRPIAPHSLPASVGGAASAVSPGLAQRMQAAFDRIDDETGRHNQVSLRALRNAVGVARLEFDACLDHLRYAGVFTLAPHEGRFGPIPPEEADAGIPGPSGRLVYAARR